LVAEQHRRSFGEVQNSGKSLKEMEPMSGVEPLTY
jgi:hypothetical protein